MRMRLKLILPFCLALLVSAWWLSSHRPHSKPLNDPLRSFELYDFGWFCGQNDRLTPRPRDPMRYAEQIAAYRDLDEFQKVFSQGYDNGFNHHPDEPPMSESESSYDHEFRRGRTDAWNRNPASAASPAYRDGFEGRAHTFGRPY